MKNETKNKIKTICKITFREVVIAGALVAGTGVGLSVATFAGGFVDQYLTLDSGNETINKMVKELMVCGTAAATCVIAQDKTTTALAKAFKVDF